VWAGVTVDPRTVAVARAVFGRMMTAIDEDRFDPAGEARSLGTSQRFDQFVAEWVTHYADKAGVDERGLTSNALPSMLQVVTSVKVAGVCLGALTLEQLVASPLVIERWLDGAMTDRGWKPRTWNRYYELLHSICHRATRWRTHDVPRMDRNPMDAIERKKVGKKTYKANFQPNRIYEDMEDRLFAALEVLNQPLHLPNGRAKLTMETAQAIRGLVAEGGRQKDVAAAFQVSPAVVSDIVAGHIWNPDKYRPSTKGDEMRRRLIAAFDGGLRAGEMMLIQLKHVNFRRPRVYIDPQDGTRTELYAIELPAANTKGGKSHGETQYIHAGSTRFKLMLDQRRTQLKNHPEAYVFGTEAGAYQASFRKQWTKLFKAAGLDYGRDQGLVWHTTRHEFISRTAENTGDPVMTQEIARLKDLETARIYMHARDDRKLAAAIGLNRRA
jgi:integrase